MPETITLPALRVITTCPAGAPVLSDWVCALGEHEVRLVQRDAVLDEARQLVRVLRPHDHTHVREDGLPPLRHCPVVLQPILLLQQPARMHANSTSTLST